MSETKSDMVELAALWQSTSKAGRVYYSGRLGTARIMAFPANEKKNEKAPDLKLFIAPGDDWKTKGTQQKLGGQTHDDDKPPF